MTIYMDWGRKNERVKRQTVRLTKGRERRRILTIGRRRAIREGRESR